MRRMARNYKQADSLQRLPFTLRLLGYCTRCLAFLFGSAWGGGRALEAVRASHYQCQVTYLVSQLLDSWFYTTS